MNTAQPKAWEVWVLALATLACLLPFLGKPVHMDDPLFIWAAKQIQKHPLDFYGFNVNWDGETKPMSEVTQNPPLASYYMAVVGSLLGWSETALHFGFLLAALAAVLAVYFVARDLCGHPLFAALATLATPAFLVSSTGLMCDTMMLAFWLWSIFFWMRGLAQASQLHLALAALLMAACALTKYFGVSLIPLLAVYAAMTQRKAGAWLLYLGAVVLILLGYQWWTEHLYGKNLLFHAAGFATHARVGGVWSSKFWTGLSFTGGCVSSVSLAAPLLWGKRGVIATAVGIAVVVLTVAMTKSAAGFSVVDGPRLNWLYIAQWSVFVVGGACILVFAVLDAQKNRDAKALLLLLWVVGTFIFTSVCNWTISARNILPLVPAAAILLARRLEERQGVFPMGFRLAWVSVALSFGVAWTLARADLKVAQSARTAAQTVYEKLVWHSKSITFEGHWGFQYYMEQLGATAAEKTRFDLTPDRAVVVPLGNSPFGLPSKEKAVLSDEYDLSAPYPVALMSVDEGGGFYSDAWGPAPFVFCHPPVDIYQIYLGK